VNINATLIGQALWFLFFIWLVMKWVWPYFQRTIAERQKTIADGLAAAEKGRKELENAKSAEEETIRAARQRALQIEEQARRRANEEIEAARKTAATEAERIIAAAQQRIEMEMNRAREGLRKEVATLAVRGAAQLLEREVDPKAHAELLARLAAQI
jgi:F-type H+-transporting ATPase subunit b